MNLIQQSNILLNPSLIEGFGIVVLGRICLLANQFWYLIQNLYLTLVEDNVDGFVIDSDNPEMWSEKIIEIFQDESQQSKTDGSSWQTKGNVKNIQYLN